MTKPGRLWAPSRQRGTALGRSAGLTIRPRLAARRTSVTLPPDIPGIYVWYDGLNAATYDGSGFLTGITDGGPNGIDITPDSGTGPVATTYDVNGVPSDLPGPFGVVSPTNHLESASGLGKVLTDFTVMAIVPTSSTQATGNAMFSLYGDDGGGSTYQFLLNQGATTGSIQGILRTFGLEIDVDFGNTTDGSHAIVFFRRDAGTDLIMDCWYDSLGGGGIQKPARQTYGSDPTTGTITLDRLAFGGRGSTSQTWATNPIHAVAVYDRLISDAEELALAQGAGVRLGFTGIT